MGYVPIGAMSPVTFVYQFHTLKASKPHRYISLAVPLNACRSSPLPWLFCFALSFTPDVRPWPCEVRNLYSNRSRRDLWDLSSDVNCGCTSGIASKKNRVYRQSTMGTTPGPKGKAGLDSFRDIFLLIDDSSLFLFCFIIAWILTNNYMFPLPLIGAHSSRTRRNSKQSSLSDDAF